MVGTEADTFLFGFDHGEDAISFFELGLDVIDLTALGVANFAPLTVGTGPDGDILFDTGAGTILLVGINTGEIGAGNFLL